MSGKRRDRYDGWWLVENGWRQKWDDALSHILLRELRPLVLEYGRALYPMDKLGVDMLNVLLLEREVRAKRYKQTTFFATLNDLIAQRPRQISRWCWIPREHVGAVVRKYNHFWDVHLSSGWPGFAPFKHYNKMEDIILSLLKEGDHLIMVEFNDGPRPDFAVAPVGDNDAPALFDFIKAYGTLRLANRTIALEKNL